MYILLTYFFYRGGVGIVNLLPLGTSDMKIWYIVILLKENCKFGWNGGK